MKALNYKIDILSQPTETTCGPTCISSIYAYHGLQIPLEQTINEIKYTEGGGTLGVHLLLDALNKGFKASIYTHNLNVFDPSWFQLESEALHTKLLAQSQLDKDTKTVEASKHYAEFLEKGGEIHFEQLTPEFLYQILHDYGPVICGLSATYLYMSEREVGPDCRYDDLHGVPQGHFVILKGMTDDLMEVNIADPLATNPMGEGHKYKVSTQHFINSILIGVITYDANIMIISKEPIKK